MSDRCNSMWAYAFKMSPGPGIAPRWTWHLYGWKPAEEEEVEWESYVTMQWADKINHSWGTQLPSWVEPVQCSDGAAPEFSPWW